MKQPTVFLISLTRQMLPKPQLKHLLGRSKPPERPLRRRHRKRPSVKDKPRRKPNARREKKRKLPHARLKKRGRELKKRSAESKKRGSTRRKWPRRQKRSA